ncbi:vegetative cell wall protein gp1-like [Maniola jurtina]|uniref:vegetative cell wall protein gp1-like n=1 Tax=Maniola jurtina TaxID=191418 RepID=UPI001E689450|nr:vegetative cell wall protein gp1-like [Maniola jurtina]
MLVTVILLLITCGIVQSSEIHPVAPAGAAPIVTASSSQYFERTFNRLIATPPVLEPVLPVAPAPVVPVFPAAQPRPFLSVLPIAPAPPVVVEATRTTSVPANPTNPQQSAPVEPNIAIAIATAHAAAPVATILLPPYPFGFPPSFGVLPQAPQAPSDPNTRESTTLKTTTTVQATSTQREEDATTPLPSNTDNNFALAPSNQNVNFRQYLAPQLPAQGSGPQQLPAPRPQQFPGPNVRPQQFPETDPRPQQYPEPNPRPQQCPGLTPRPQQFSGSNLRPQQFPGSNPRPQQFPGSNPRPQQFPVQTSRPQQLPIPNPWPQHVPQHLPQPDSRPIKFKTNVEVVPVPLAYIAPPSPHQHHHHHHQSLKAVPYIHKYIPKTSKIIIIRPVSASRIRTVRVPAGFATYGPPKLVKRAALKRSQNIRFTPRDEQTTFGPINRPFTRPPRL